MKLSASAIRDLSMIRMTIWRACRITFMLMSFLMASLSGFAGGVDSLIQVLQGAPPDTNRVNLLTLITRQLISSKPAEARDYANEALGLARDLGFKKGQASALNSLGMISQNEGQFTTALDFYNQALPITVEIGFLQAQGSVLNNMGSTYVKMGDLDKAMSYYLQNRKIQESLSNKAGISDIDLNIGSIYLILGEDKLALDKFNLVIQNLTGTPNQYLLALAWGNRGAVYQDLNHLDSALVCHTTSLGIHEQIGNQMGIANENVQLGLVLDHQGKPELAIERLMTALAINDSLESKIGQATVMVQLGEVLCHAGRHAEGQDYLKRGLALGKDLKDLKVQRAAAKALSEEYAQLGMFSDAYTFSSIYTRLNDSINNENNKRDIFLKEFQYDADLKAYADSLETVKMAAEKDAQIREQRLYTWVGFSGAGAALLILLVLFRSFRQKAKSNIIITQEKKRSDDLLLNILPRETADELKATGKATPRRIDGVCIMFTDFQGFTSFSTQVPPDVLVNELDTQFSVFDDIVERHGLEKIKTIGDAFMCAGGLHGNEGGVASRIVRAGLEILEYVDARNREARSIGGHEWSIRIGIHTGEVVAGVVGKRKFAFDIWGDAVNTASRIENAGQIGALTISHELQEMVKDEFRCRHLGKVMAKNKGEIDLYVVEGPR